MAFYFALTTTENSYLLSNRPSADAIWNALETVPLPQETRWVSPHARIKRFNKIGVLIWATEVTSVLEVQGPYTPEKATDIARQIALGMDVALARLSLDWSFTRTDVYAEAQYGPLSEWFSGRAATPQIDHTAVVQAENAALAAEQAGADSAEIAKRAAAATGEYVEQAGGRIGSIFGTTIGGILKPIPSATILVVGAVVVVGLFAAVKVWRAA
jgi:hypothetical protein